MMIQSIGILVSALVVLSNCENHYLTPKEFTTDRLLVDCSPATDGDNVFKYSAQNLNKSLGQISFEEFRGKVILVLNVATFCRSATDYPQLNQLKDKFGDDLEIVGFPSNQFWNQEPSTNEEIYDLLYHVRPGKGFVPQFQLTEKVDVNGVNSHPLFSFLKRSCPSTDFKFAEQKYYLWDPKNVRDVKWNFEKFLIDGKSGQPIRRYDTNYNAIKIEADIQKLIKKHKEN